MMSLAFGMAHLSVIIDDLDIMGPIGIPDETDTPLFIDSYAVLAVPIAFQALKPIAGRPPQILDAHRVTKLIKLAQCRLSNCLPQLWIPVAVERPRCLCPERSDHTLSVLRYP